MKYVATFHQWEYYKWLTERQILNSCLFLLTVLIVLQAAGGQLLPGARFGIDLYKGFTVTENDLTSTAP